MRYLVCLCIFLWIYIELLIFIKVASFLGVFITLLLIILGSVMGLSLIRTQGFANLRQLRSRLVASDNPTNEIINHLTTLLAGVLFFIPGFFTDFIALLLLIPFTKKIMLFLFFAVLKKNKKTTPIYEQRNTDKKGRTIEGEYQRKDDNEDNSKK